MFDLSLGKIAVIAVIALFLVGPERLPHYAAQLGRWVRVARGMLDGAKDRMREELGPDFDDTDWQRLDPRQYDPRKIIRDALLEPAAPATARRPAAVPEPDQAEEPAPGR